MKLPRRVGSLMLTIEVRSVSRACCVVGGGVVVVVVVVGGGVVGVVVGVVGVPVPGIRVMGGTGIVEVFSGILAVIDWLCV
jgi:hypothetical protein